MLRILLFITLFSASSFAFDRGLICAYREGRALYPRVRTMAQNDKYKHCVLTCTVANRCGVISALNLGVLKEIKDIFGPGNAEVEDMTANIDGARLANSGEARNFNECALECQRFHPMSLLIKR